MSEAPLKKAPLPKQTIGCAVQVLGCVEVLAGYAVRGISNTALAQGMGIAPSAVTRIMNTLIDQGWARKDAETGAFYPSTRCVQLFAKVVRDLDAEQSKLDTLRGNLLRHAD
jgi:DNA-binding IclR family transcriptional regulator